MRADFQHVLGEGVAHALGQFAGGHVVAVAHQQRQLVFAEAGDGGLPGHAVQALAHRRHQLVGGVEADHLQQLRVVIRLDQQQAVGSALAGGLGHRRVQQPEEGGSVQ
jgi:hypothetical protein